MAKKQKTPDRGPAPVTRLKKWPKPITSREGRAPRERKRAAAPVPAVADPENVAPPTSRKPRLKAARRK